MQYSGLPLVTVIDSVPLAFSHFFESCSSNLGLLSVVELSSRTTLSLEVATVSLPAERYSL
jgi:hypothetical protein